MNQTKPILKYLDSLIIILLLIITIIGITSFDTSKSFEFINQYGDTVQMWGSGIYAHDSYFKAPILIGSDFTILVFAVPYSIFTFMRTRKDESVENLIRSFGVLCLLLYYTASVAFGVTYNHLHLVYIALFSLCFFSVCKLLARLHTLGTQHQQKVCTYEFTKGMKIFLIVAGISLIVAWLPDIMTSIINGTSLDLIEVYTTEITYVLDMGIISPLLFITYYLVKKKRFMGYVLLRMAFKVCLFIGIMLPMQTIFQLMADITIPLPALITKVFIFVAMAFFAAYFDHHAKKTTRYLQSN